VVDHPVQFVKVLLSQLFEAKVVVVLASKERNLKLLQQSHQTFRLLLEEFLVIHLTLQKKPNRVDSRVNKRRNLELLLQSNLAFLLLLLHQMYLSIFLLLKEEVKVVHLPLRT